MHTYIHIDTQRNMHTNTLEHTGTVFLSQPLWVTLLSSVGKRQVACSQGRHGEKIKYYPPPKCLGHTKGKKKATHSQSMLFLSVLLTEINSQSCQNLHCLRNEATVGVSVINWSQDRISTHWNTGYGRVDALFIWLVLMSSSKGCDKGFSDGKVLILPSLCHF